MPDTRTREIDDLPNKHEVIQEHLDLLVRIAQAEGPFSHRVRRKLEQHGYEWRDTSVGEAEASEESDDDSCVICGESVSDGVDVASGIAHERCVN
jgi:hypothetical protein